MTAIHAQADVHAFQSHLSKELGAARAPQLLCASLADALARARDAHTALVVLLHSELHEDAHEFVHTVLGDDAVGRLMSEGPFTVWGASALSDEGWKAAQMAGATQFPFMGVFVATSPTANKHVCVARSLGLAQRDAAVSWLEAARAQVGPTLTMRREEVLQRERDRILRDDQEKRYEEVQAEDRRRMEEAEAREAERRAEDARRDEAEQKRREEAELAEEAEALARVVRMSTQEQMVEQALAAAARLPSEPAEDEADTTTVRMTLPGGTVLMRRFRAEEPQRAVRDFAAVALHRLGFTGYQAVKVGSRAPAMTMEDGDDGRSLREAGLAPSARLFVTAKEAADAVGVARAAIEAGRDGGDDPAAASRPRGPSGDDGVPFQRRAAREP